MAKVMSFYLFSIIALLISSCSDSTAPDVTNPNIDNAPASIERVIGSEPTGFGTTNEENFVPEYSTLIGQWDIVRFNDYEPTQLSMGGKNHAYVRFEDGHVGFQMECNGSGMPTKLSVKGVLKNKSPYGGLIATQMGCVAEKQERDESLFSFFANEPRILLISENTLRLVGSQQELILRKRETMPSDLNGVWQLQYVDGVIAVYPARSRYDYLMFRIGDKESIFTGFDGCNNIGAKINFQDMRVMAEISNHKMRGCSTELEPLSLAYWDLVGVDGQYEVDGNHLLIISNGKRYHFTRLDEKPQRPITTIEQKLAPIGTKLCEVRASLSDEKFPDYFSSTQAVGGYKVRLTDDTTYDYLQDFQFGYVSLSEHAKPILFEKSGQVLVVKRVSSYPTRLNFNIAGVYCSSEGEWAKGKVWPAYLSSSSDMAKLSNAQAPVLSVALNQAGTLIDNNGCVGFKPEDQPLDTINLIFNHWALKVGHDEGGFFLNQREKIFRVGDKVSGNLLSLDDKNAQLVVNNSLTHPDIGTSNMPACPKPAKVMMQ